ncbi:MAG: cupin domain-containing protein [Candidatus Zixiibacteriota bacterium]
MKKKIYNIEDIPENFINGPDSEDDMMTKYLGALAGSEKMYINIDYVKPNAKSAKYHSHTHQEEFFIILEGKGRVRLSGKEYEVKKGDFFAKPPGKGIAHQFINDSNEMLVILDCGIKSENDMIMYPDEGILLFKRDKLVFKKIDSKTWDSDPNWDKAGDI